MIHHHEIQNKIVMKIKLQWLTCKDKKELKLIRKSVREYDSVNIYILQFVFLIYGEIREIKLIPRNIIFV